MKLDQDLCLNLLYELDPRVRCAFGNVYSHLATHCCSGILLSFYISPPLSSHCFPGIEDIYIDLI